MAFSKIMDIAAGKLGIWKLFEPSERLALIYRFSLIEKREFEKIKNENRKREYLAVRLLLKEMLPDNEGITYCSGGKPGLVNSVLHISISHSPELAVILLSENNTGVDAENIQRRTETVASRFLSEKELDDTYKSPDPQLSRILYWCAKEAVFKYSSFDYIDFKSQITILPFYPEAGGGKFVGELNDGVQKFTFKFTYFFYENNAIVYCVKL